MKYRWLRRTFQTVALAAVVYMALGFSQKSFENFCPFGGLESLYSLATTRSISCAVSPWNFGIFAALIGLTLASRKSFCGWVCPIGLVYEMLSKLPRRMFQSGNLLSTRGDRRLRLGRYLVLAIVLMFTWKTGELVFRGYDPYYLMFSGLGHGTLGWISMATMAALLAAGLLFPMAWCRYACPLNAVMDPLSYASPLVVSRRHELCTGCQACDRSCPHNLLPSQAGLMRHRDCTNCLTCVDACNQPGCLSLEVRNRWRRNDS